MASLATGQGRPGSHRVIPLDSTYVPLYTGLVISTGKHRVGGVTRFDYVTVDSVLPASPAALAGVRAGDELLSINGFDLVTQRDSARYRGVGLPTAIRIRRGNDILEVVIVPAAVPPQTRPPQP